MNESVKLTKKDNDKLISKLFFGMLPVEVLIYAMGFINTLVDGTIAGRFIDPVAVGVVGLYFPMVYIYTAVGNVLLSGSAILCGRYLGRGEIDRTSGVFSLNLTVAVIIGGVLTAVCLIVPGFIVAILGAGPDLKAELAKYVMGFAFGIIPMLLAQQIASFLQMERQSKRGYIGIAGMIISNVLLDILFVAILDMGIWGLALATSLSNWTYFLLLVPYYFTSKAQLKYKISNILWRELPELLKIGFPGALLVACIAVRAMVLNRILLVNAGTAGVAALAAFNMVYGFFIAFCLGNGAVFRMLTSVFVGEEDKASMKAVLKLVLTKGLAMSCVIGVIVFVTAAPISGLFFADHTLQVYVLTKQLFQIYAFCIPLILICQVNTNYFQTMGHGKFVNVLSVVDGFFSMIIPSLILAPILGALGVWLANPIGILITILMAPLYEIIYWKRIPHGLDEWMMLKPDFGVADEDCLDIAIHDMTEVTQTAERVQGFCKAHNTDSKVAYCSALCLEEMAGNVVAHGFNKDKKKHSLNVKVAYLKDHVLLRIKDDCIPFDPAEYAELLSEDNPLYNIGIRMVYKIAADVNYQNLLGLNVLTITIK